MDHRNNLGDIRRQILTIFLVLSLILINTTTQARVMSVIYTTEEDIANGSLDNCIQVVQDGYTIYVAGVKNDNKQLMFDFLITNKEGKILREYRWYITSIFKKKRGAWGSKGYRTYGPWSTGGLFLDMNKAKEFNEISLEFNIYTAEGDVTITNVKVPLNHNTLYEGKTYEVNTSRRWGYSGPIFIDKIEVTPIALYITYDINNYPGGWVHTDSSFYGTGVSVNDIKSNIIDYSPKGKVVVGYPYTYTEDPKVARGDVSIYYIHMDVRPIDIGSGDYKIKKIAENDEFYSVELEGQEIISEARLWTVLGKESRYRWHIPKYEHINKSSENMDFVQLTLADIQIEAKMSIDDLINRGAHDAIQRLDRYITKYDFLREVYFNDINIKRSLFQLRLDGAISFPNNESYKKNKDCFSEIIHFRKKDIEDLKKNGLWIRERGRIRRGWIRFQINKLI